MMRWSIILLLIILINTSVAFAADFDIEKHKNSYPKGDTSNISDVQKMVRYMYEFDQQLRKAHLANPKNSQLKNDIDETDEFHTAKMKEILGVHGWLNISKFGKEYDNAAWLLVQHADNDPFFQAGVLLILSEMMEKKETNARNFAYLYDRVAGKLNHIGMYQKYGTQIIVSDQQNIELQPYKGRLEDINKRRKAIGLEPVEEYLKKAREVYSR